MHHAFPLAYQNVTNNLDQPDVNPLSELYQELMMGLATSYLELNQVIKEIIKMKTKSHFDSAMASAVMEKSLCCTCQSVCIIAIKNVKICLYVVLVMDNMELQFDELFLK